MHIYKESNLLHDLGLLYKIKDIRGCEIVGQGGEAIFLKAFVKIAILPELSPLTLEEGHVIVLVPDSESNEEAS